MSSRHSPQLGLFAGEYTRTAREQGVFESRARELSACEPIAQTLDPRVRMGTSSWSFSGWAGLVYSAERSASELAREGLREYVEHPLLRTVGIDRGYYAAIPPADLQQYAEQTPEHFVFCTKAPEAITSPIVSKHRDPGNAGHFNEDFLNAARFVDEMVGPFLEHLGARTGPFILEFPPLPRDSRLQPEPFAEALDDFLSALPEGLQLAVELRDPALMTEAYARVLTRRGCAHVYNYWSRMPSITSQLRAISLTKQPFAVTRLLLRPGTQYQTQREKFAPFDALVEPDLTMRDEVCDVVEAATRAGLESFVLVNNKAEGSSPRTVRAIAERLNARALRSAR
ncbi:MAG: DUF72 domain-containing protein [Deltaproteobacteria bacterium]|nr:DUF72 domain-containing protein [Deltaproteobacteria bacterium]